MGAEVSFTFLASTQKLSVFLWHSCWSLCKPGNWKTLAKILTACWILFLTVCWKILSSDEEVGDEDGDNVRGQGQEDLGAAGTKQLNLIQFKSLEI